MTPSIPQTAADGADDWLALGGDHIWLPYAQMKTAPTPVMATSTKGSRIRLNDGRELVDGVASWWTACHGYSHPHIQAAMAAQLAAMPHVMFGGINHEPALKLAKRIAALTPGDLTRVLFVDSGSVAIEAAMKMAVQYWLNLGEKGKSRFVSFRHGYHGDTMGCMALCDPQLDMYVQFEDYVPPQFIAALPDTAEGANAFDALLSREAGRIAGVVLEPLVQGVGGMKFHRPEILRCVAELCKKHGVLFIADEIFTGFGRTGSMFACEKAGVVPDILCLGKALSACMVTLAAVVARTHVFEAFWSDNPKKALMHGPTYMANPLACAAANASLDLFESEPRLQQAASMEATLLAGLASCRDVRGVVDVRAMGAIGVVQFKSEPDRMAMRRFFVEQGVWIRNWGDHVYLTPALNIDAGDLDRLILAVTYGVQKFAS